MRAALAGDEAIVTVGGGREQTVRDGPRARRVLWLLRHRTARYEEVGALLRVGAEVVPIEGSLDDFPNAVELGESADPWYPEWRPRCSIPTGPLDLIRSHDYFTDPEHPSERIIEALDAWIDVVIVGSFSPIAHGLLRHYRGGVVLRAYGGYPYTLALGPVHRRQAALQDFGTSNRYAFSPALPYQRLVEDPRLTRNEHFWPGTVTKARLGHDWAGPRSDPVAAEVIGLIGRYRSDVYRQFITDYGDLPLRILGQNEPGGPHGDDPRIAGTLPDDEYFAVLASSRLVIYAGLGSRYHLHYHALEAMMMGVPVLFFRDSALAQVAAFMGLSTGDLRTAGMCGSPAEAHAAADRMLKDPAAAEAISAAQEPIREIFRPERWDDTVRLMVASVSRWAAFEANADASGGDIPPPRGVADWTYRKARGAVRRARRVVGGSRGG